MESVKPRMTLAPTTETQPEPSHEVWVEKEHYFFFPVNPSTRDDNPENTDAKSPEKKKRKAPNVGSSA